MASIRLELAAPLAMPPFSGPLRLLEVRRLYRLLSPRDPRGPESDEKALDCLQDVKTSKYLYIVSIVLFIAIYIYS